MAFNSCSNGNPLFKQPQRQIWDYKHADFTKACELIDDTDWDSLLLEDDINVSTLNWHRQFLEIMSECIPHRTLPKRHNLPWLNQHIVRGIRKCNNAFQKFKKSPNYNSAKRYKVLRNSVTSMIRKSRATYFKNINPANKKQFWKTIKYLNKQRSTIPTLAVSNVSASTDSAKATLLSDFFSSWFNTTLSFVLAVEYKHRYQLLLCHL